MQKTIVRREVLTESNLSLSTSGLHPVLAKVFAQRGIADQTELDTRLQGLLSPNLLTGIEVAAAYIGDAVIAQKKLLIIGDFDADGATSSALAVLALSAFGATSVDFLVPNRFEFGYGLTPELVEVAIENPKKKPDLLITVDNGISSIEGVKVANAHGMQVVVTDHHLPGEQLPEAVAIVNPNQRGCGFPSKALAGVGVIFYVMIAVCRYLETHSWFTAQKKTAPKMADFLDLVALGTVADVVPLDQNNRILVHQGLARIRSGRCRPGITALLQVAKKNPRWLVSQDLGFAVGPRLNAAGRLDDMGIGIACLLEPDAEKALEKAKILHELNQERRSIEMGMQAEACALLEGIEASESPCGVCLYQDNWHQGVIGILAGRLKERFGCPVAIFASVNEDILKGSLRSIRGVHIRDVLAEIDVLYPGLMQGFGGHAMAAGVSIQRNQFATFQKAFIQLLSDTLTPESLQQVLLSDGALAPEYLNAEVAESLRVAAPWGQQFDEPLFDGVFNIVRQKWLGDKHIKLFLSDHETGTLVDAIAFNQEKPYWSEMIAAGRVRILFKMDINDYQNRRQLQLIVQYAEAVDSAF